MGIFDWYRRQKYWLSLSKEQKERYKKERECHGHLFVEVKGGGKKGEEPYPDEIYLECSKCGYGYYKSTLTTEERNKRRYPKPIKNWNEPRKREDLDFTLTNSIEEYERKLKNKEREEEKKKEEKERRGKENMEKLKKSWNKK
jgi:hypothetical protein